MTSLGSTTTEGAGFGRLAGRAEFGGGAAGRAPEGDAVGVGVLLGPPVVRERDRGQRFLGMRGALFGIVVRKGLGLCVDLAQLLHRDQGLGRQLIAALGQPAAALLHHPRAAQD